MVTILPCSLNARNEFCLISSIVSLSLPPEAGSGFVIDNVFWYDVSVAVSDAAVNPVIVFAPILDSIPPPFRYRTVNVVLEGELP